jgi:hypothetical protein
MERYLPDSVTDFLVIPFLGPPVGFLLGEAVNAQTFSVAKFFVRMTLPNLPNCLTMHNIGVYNGHYVTMPQFSQKIAAFSLK